MSVAHEDVAPPVPGSLVIRVRELGAVTRPAPAVAFNPDTDSGSYEELLESLSECGAFLPAPPGLVFRSAETLRAWMEQNYIGLHEGVTFLSGRCEARVHVRAASHAMTSEEIEAGEARGHRRGTRTATRRGGDSRAERAQAARARERGIPPQGERVEHVHRVGGGAGASVHGAPLRADRSVDPARLRSAGPRGLSDVLS